MMELSHYLQAGTTTISNLVLDYYHRLGLSSEEALMYLQLCRFHQQGNEFPDMHLVSERIGISDQQGYSLLDSLLKKQIIDLKTTTEANGSKKDAYDLTLFFDRVSQYQKKEPKKSQSDTISSVQLYAIFEREFGRPLSPIEIETIGYWLTEDGYSMDLILLALREAVLNQARNLKYIDRILLNWEKQNLRSKAEIQNYQHQRKKAIQETEKEQLSQSNEIYPEVSLYNWGPQENKE